MIIRLAIPLLLSCSPALLAESKPLKALLVAGGCCHDYTGQHKVLADGIQALANVQVDVIWTADKGTNPPLPLYDSPDWAKGYDVVIHDECAAANKDLKVLKNILAAHQTIPAVHLHCAMHSFRTGTDHWFKHLGLQSSGHGPQEPVAIEFTDDQHPITATLEDWTTIKEELYNNVNIFDAHPLATGTQTFTRKDKKVTETAVVAWVNEKQGAPSFSTTIGHNTDTVRDPRYLELVTRGLLWSCGKLSPDFLVPFKGKNTIVEVKAEPSNPAKELGQPPKDATLVIMSASSVQTGPGHHPWKAVDGNKDSRWCAENGSKPQWLQLELVKPSKITGVDIIWESENNAYQHRIEGSGDGKTWTLLNDSTGNNKGGDTSSRFTGKKLRFVRITCTGTNQGGWASIREVSLKGPALKALHPKLSTAEKTSQSEMEQFAKSGNITPTIVELSPEEEARILKDTTVPDGFEKTLFAPWQTANYPVYVAASPEGDLYVSSDGNGSLGRDPHRGRVLRLRDTNRDGRADQVTEFIKDIDSPRGLIWDHDRLYLLHPPHISVFYDRDRDGVSEESQVLIKDIAFGFKDRPADHTTNGLEMGIDGWIYIAGGDFGFLKATGTDGRTLQHRGGGVIRFRPDGTGLELFATGTRNILGTPASPTLDIFARDNTNDGGGWDVRFHHFTGLEDHGYPRLYMNFEKEIVQPLADYGGGSGCGSVYIHEPGFPTEWANAPFTCDWGRAGSFRHTVTPKGATFEETAEPKQFIKMTRPTDADVDGRSAVYQAAWKGPATFKWAGPETGYIVRVTPKDYKPAPLPNFERLPNKDLVELLSSPSHIRTLAAQRTLLRRGVIKETNAALLRLISDQQSPLRARIAGLYAFIQINPSTAASALSFWAPKDAALQPYLLRALGDLSPEQARKHSSRIVAGTQSANPRSRLEACVAVARLNLIDLAPHLTKLLADPDPIVVHTAYQALALLGAREATLPLLSDPDQDTRKAAAWALMRMHSPELVEDMLGRLAKETDPALRRPLLSILCRLYHREGEWKGDSWGTRPDTRGPYYQPVTWELSEPILTALKAILAEAPPEEAAFIVKKLNKNRIQSNEALLRIIALAKDDGKLIPDALTQMATVDTIPADALPLVLEAANNPETPPAALAHAVAILSKSDDRAALPSMVAALTVLQQAKGFGKDLAAARKSFFQSPKLENHHLALEELAAADPDSPQGQVATAGVLTLATRKNGSPESREMSLQAVNQAWNNPAQRIALMRACSELRLPLLNERILVALHDPDASVAQAAKKAANRLKIQIPGEDKTPKVSSLDPAKAIDRIVKHKGDAALGEAIFTRATCIACHTTSQDQEQKGPYLGNISETYRRNELAEAILDPNKTIAQGFASNVITLNDGSTLMGFVTNEAGDEVSLRDIAAQLHTIKKADIKSRSTLPTSMMPAGLMNGFTVHETASLLDYLEKLAKKK